jgi:hypothetical protein
MHKIHTPGFFPSYLCTLWAGVSHTAEFIVYFALLAFLFLLAD